MTIENFTYEEIDDIMNKTNAKIFKNIGAMDKAGRVLSSSLCLHIVNIQST